MRRRLLPPLLSAGLLTALLMPSIAFGLAGDVGGRSVGSASNELVTLDGPAVSPAAVAAILPDAAASPASPVRPSTAGSPMTAASPITAASPTPSASAVPAAAAAPVPARAETSAKPAGAAPTERPAAVERAKPRIRLGCAAIRSTVTAVADPLVAAPDVAPAVACRWTRVPGDAVRAYQLWRAVDAPGGEPRRLIATVAADAKLTFIDRDVSRGHAYTYAVTALDRDGAKLALGGPVIVRIPPRHDALRLSCALTTLDDDRGVGCKWSEARHPAAAGYVLWRSVDGGPREKVHRIGLDGRHGFFDTDVKPGQTIRYAVVVVDKAGRRIGHGGPDVVRIPPRPAVKPTPSDATAPVEGRGAVVGHG